jgi:hypothetical protein
MILNSALFAGRITIVHTQGGWIRLHSSSWNSRRDLIGQRCDAWRKLVLETIVRFASAISFLPFLGFVGSSLSVLKDSARGTNRDWNESPEQSG